MSPAVGRESAVNVLPIIGGRENCPPVFSLMMWREPMTAPSKDLSELFKKKESRGRRRGLAGIRLGKKIMKNMDQEKKETQDGSDIRPGTF